MTRKPSLVLAGLLTAIFLSFGQTSAMAAIVEYDLIIAEELQNYTGRPVPGMTINGGIPGPTLRFKIGDLARIRVHNRLDEDSSIHWHGVLVPPGMDGVPSVSFPPIAPGAAFTYEFPIRQSGTYWYHSHSSLQEQSGVYGSIVIEPELPRLAPDRDYVLLFSEWTDDDPHDVNRTLKRGSHWYSLEKGGAQSIVGAARSGRLGDYLEQDLQRMPPMDISDVAYDYFLANGMPAVHLSAKPGETVLLRIIDGSSTTYFHLEFAGGPMTIVSADGQDVEPVEHQRILISVAETYDVLVEIPDEGSFEFRATAQDGSGYASVWLGDGPARPAPNVPKPDLYQNMHGFSLARVFALTPEGSMGMSDGRVKAGDFDRPGTGEMNGMDMGHNGHGPAPAHTPPAPAVQPHGGMDHGPAPAAAPPAEPSHGAMGHGMPMTPDAPPPGRQYGRDFGFLAADISSRPDLAEDGGPKRPWPPYDSLRSIQPTAFAEHRPVREVRLTLDGDMERYVWSVGGKPLASSDSITIHQGEVARFILINRTMMHHPMHLHGHFFRVVNAQGDYAPLKHTVNVAPMSTTVIEFDANEFGDWFFHCHLLYHMKNGMARVVHYQGYQLPPDTAAVRSKLYKDAWYFFGRADVLSNMTQGELVYSNSANILSLDWEAGWGHVDETLYEATFTWGLYQNRFLTFFAGANAEGDLNGEEEVRAVAGLEYLLPANLELRAWLDQEADARFAIGRDFDLTPRLTLFGEAEYDTRDKWGWEAGLSYLIDKNISLTGVWHSEFGVGAGLEFRF